MTSSETVQALKVFLGMAEAAPKVEDPKAEEVVLAEEPAAPQLAEEPAQEQAVTRAEFEELKAIVMKIAEMLTKEEEPAAETEMKAVEVEASAIPAAEPLKPTETKAPQRVVLGAMTAKNTKEAVFQLYNASN